VQKISADAAAQEAFRMIFRRRKVRIEIEHTSLRVETTTESCEPFPADPRAATLDGLHINVMETYRPLRATAEFPPKDESRR
jgi:hypothetical protein